MPAAYARRLCPPPAIVARHAATDRSTRPDARRRRADRRSGKEDEAFFQGTVWLCYRSVEHADRLGAKVQDAAQRYSDARGAGLRLEELLTVADSAI